MRSQAAALLNRAKLVGSVKATTARSSRETVETRARAEGIAPEQLFLRVGVHGLLHVVGYDHKTRSETGEMESEERRLLLQHLTSSEVEELF